MSSLVKGSLLKGLGSSFEVLDLFLLLRGLR